MKGWVYVITNKAMPALVKVGYSSKDPQLRAREFDGTGAPHPYVVEYELLVSSPRDVEQQVHRALAQHREAKEWFRCSIHDAVSAIRTATDGTAILETFVSEQAIYDAIVYGEGDDDVTVDTRKRIATDPRTPPDVLDHILVLEASTSVPCSDYDPEIAILVASNPSAPSHLLAHLVEWEWECPEHGYKVITAVAGNPSCPVNLLERLVLEYSNEEALCAEAVNSPTCSASVLAVIRWAWPKTPLSAAAVAHPTYSNDAYRTLIDEKLRDDGEWKSLCLEDLDSCDTVVLSALAANPDETTRATIAGYEHCPVGCFPALAIDQSPRVRTAVVKNSACPVGTIEQFCNSQFYEYRVLAAKHPDCPDQLLDQLLFDPEPRVRKAAHSAQIARRK